MSHSDDAFTLGKRVSTPLPEVFDGAVSGLDAAGSLARLRELTIAQNRLEAERSAVLSRLYELRDEARMIREETSRRFVDDWDELVAEVGAVLGTGRSAAGAALHRALDLRERHPRLFRLHAHGLISLQIVREVLRAGVAIVDDEVALEFDQQISRWLAARTETALTNRAVQDAADKILVMLDPAAVREKPPAPAERLDFHTRADGMVDLEAVIPMADAIRLSALIAPVAQSVCRNDGRTMSQRQVAALVAVAEGYETLGCRCDTEGCTLREAKPRTGAVSQDLKALAVIVLNESELFAPAQPTEADGGRATAPEPEPEAHADDADADRTDNGAVVLTGDPGISGPISAKHARDLIEASQTDFRVLGRRDPGTGKIHIRGATGYRPTWYQLLVMRLTYPTCTFPGCSVSSDKCQADHVTEYDHQHPDRGGPTTVAGANGAGNLVPLCGFHHRVKTETGWISDILADGTVEWRHPAGGVWLVPPGITRELLPDLATIIWDGPDPAVPGTEHTKNPDGLKSDAKRRAKARRALRAHNRALRHQRLDREAHEAQAKAREQERREAEQQGLAYDDTAPLKPPPF